MAVFRKSQRKLGLAGSWQPGCGEGSPIPRTDRNGSWRCMRKAVHAGRLASGDVSGGGCLCEPVTFPGTESLRRFPTTQTSQCCHHRLREEWSISRVTPLGEDSGKLGPGSLQTLLSPVSPLLILLCIFFCCNK